jgi:hypothetical protein
MADPKEKSVPTQPTPEREPPHLPELPEETWERFERSLPRKDRDRTSL